MVFQNVGLLWIINNNKHIKFEMDVEKLNGWAKVHGIIQQFAQN